MENDALTNVEAPGYEPRDVSPRGLVYFLMIVVVFLAVTSFAVQWLFGYFVKTDRPVPVVQPVFSHVRLLPPPPRVQANPGEDIREYVDSERQFLNSSGWIDEKSGIARIPIDQAMDLLLRQGLPVRNQSSEAASPSSGTSTAGEQKHP
jgi:hypothetical protein